MNILDSQYLDILERITLNPDYVEHNDRTGVGTSIRLNQHIEFSMLEGQFPLLGAKKVNWRMHL